MSNYRDLVAALPTSRGSPTCDPAWQASIQQPISATSAAGLVFVDTGLVKLSAYRSDCRGDCSPVWTASTNGPASPPRSLAKLYVATANGTVYAYGIVPERPASSSSNDPTPFGYLGILVLGALVLIVRVTRRRARGV